MTFHTRWMVEYSTPSTPGGWCSTAPWRRPYAFPMNFHTRWMVEYSTLAAALRLPDEFPLFLEHQVNGGVQHLGGGRQLAHYQGFLFTFTLF